MREQLLDIITHTHDLKILEKVLVTTDDEKTVIQSIDDGQSVIVKGILNNVISDFTGQFGMSNLEILKGYCNFPMYKADDADITVKRKKLGADEFPEELIFTGNGAKSNYRCMLASAIEPQPNFRTRDWDIDIVITKSKIEEFRQMSSILKDEQFVFIELTDGELKFNIGAPDSSENHAVIVIAEDVDGELKNIFQWKISNFLSIARLSKGDVIFRMLSKGLINIHIDSEHGQYDYYLPRYIVEETE